MKKQTKLPDTMLVEVAALEAHSKTRAEIAKSLGIKH